MENSIAPVNDLSQIASGVMRNSDIVYAHGCRQLQQHCTYNGLSDIALQ